MAVRSTWLISRGRDVAAAVWQPPRSWRLPSVRRPHRSPTGCQIVIPAHEPALRAQTPRPMRWHARASTRRGVEHRVLGPAHRCCVQQALTCHTETDATHLEDAGSRPTARASDPMRASLRASKPAAAACCSPVPLDPRRAWRPARARPPGEPASSCTSRPCAHRRAGSRSPVTSPTTRHPGPARVASRAPRCSCLRTLASRHARSGSSRTRRTSTGSSGASSPSSSHGAARRERVHRAWLDPRSASSHLRRRSDRTVVTSPSTSWQPERRRAGSTCPAIPQLRSTDPANPASLTSPQPSA